MSIRLAAGAIRQQGAGVVITESWNAPDSASIDADLSWDTLLGTFDLTSNEVRAIGSNMVNCAVSTTTIGSDGIYAQVEANTENAQFGVGVVLCASNLADTLYYGLVAEFADLVRLIRFDAGVGTTLIEKAYTAAADTVYTVRVEMNGGDLRLLVDGVEELTVTDGSPLTGEHCGIRNYSSTGTFATFDNFEAGTL